MTKTVDLPTFSSLDELTRLTTRRRGLYVRWSRGPESDLPKASSTDDLTGIELPGLSASPLDLEKWWGKRSVRVWVARRLYDYCHLPRVKDARTRPWVLHGTEAARGPDNEPLVTEVEPLGWIADQVITDACRIITEQPGRWGTLDRDEPSELTPATGSTSSPPRTTLALTCAWSPWTGRSAMLHHPEHAACAGGQMCPYRS